MRRALPLLLAVFLVAAVAGCDSNESMNDAGAPGVFVANQGNFGDGNGSVTAYNRSMMNATTDAVSSLNSIVQSVAVRDGRLLVAANSAGRVDLFATDAFSQTGQVTGLSGPRYFAFAGEESAEETAFVTDQSFNSASTVRVLDLSGDAPEVAASIEVPGTPEGITTASGRVYAALGAFGASTLVAAIDAESRQLAETVDVGCAARFVLADAESEVYAVCTDKPEVVRVDGATGDLLGSIALPDTAETAFGVGQDAAFSAGELHVVVNQDRVVRVDTQEERVTATIGPVDGNPIGGVAYDATREELYLARVAGFTTPGSVTIHDRDGTETASFNAGIAPTYVTVRGDQ
jgi:hypothetical protein